MAEEISELLRQSCSRCVIATFQNVMYKVREYVLSELHLRFIEFQFTKLIQVFVKELDAISHYRMVWFTLQRSLGRGQLNSNRIQFFNP